MTGIVETIRETDGTPTQKLIAVLQAAGITDTAELAALIGVGVRAIQKANHSSQRTTVREPEFAERTTVRQNEPQFANHSSSLPRAYIESPSEIDSYQEVKIIPLTPKRLVDARLDTRKRGSRLDPDWQLPADWRMWAKTNFPAVTDGQITSQADQFRDFWISKPGAQACKLDWEATWRNWCRKGLVIGSVRQPQHTGSFRPLTTTADDIKAAFAAAGG